MRVWCVHLLQCSTSRAGSLGPVASVYGCRVPDTHIALLLFLSWSFLCHPHPHIFPVLPPPPPPPFTPDAATKSTRHPPRRLRQCRQCPDDLQVPSRSEPGRQRPRQVYGRPRPIFDQPGQGLAGMADQRACGRTGARERIGSTAPQRRSRQAVHSQRRKLFLLKWFGCVRLACIGITVLRSLSPCLPVFLGR